MFRSSAFGNPSPLSNVLGNIQPLAANLCLNYAVLGGTQTYQPNLDSKKRKIHFAVEDTGRISHPAPHPSFGIKSCLRKKAISDGNPIQNGEGDTAEDEEMAIEPSEMIAYEQKHPLKRSKLPGKVLQKRILAQLSS